MLSQKCRVNPIETDMVPHEFAPVRYTVAIHVRDKSLMRPVLLNEHDLITPHEFVGLQEKSYLWVENCDPGRAYLAVKNATDPSTGGALIERPKLGRFQTVWF